MSSRLLVRLFFSTLLLGGLTAGVVGFISRWDLYQQLFLDFKVIEIVMTFVWLAGIGLIFSVVSQAGFFAYLTVHRFGLGIFRGLWNPVQVVLIGFVLFDLVYLRYAAFGEGESILPYIGIALFLLAVGVIVAYIKAKQTNKKAFIPALFFMVVITSAEWIPVLRDNDQDWLYFMLFPLLVCNSYQLLMLHKINEKSAIELASKQKKRGPSYQ
ncbi:MAG: KinB-signaling pathway activation protein [Bacillus sp. (in: firmicutes)]